MSTTSAARVSGLLIPLFSMASSRSWGIGEISDLVPMSTWMRQAGQAALIMLPVSAMAEGQHSPYSALSAMALDPIYVSLADVEEFAALGGEAALDEAMRRDLAVARAAPTVDYDRVRKLKRRALELAYARFLDAEWRRQSTRARTFAAWAAGQDWWLGDYALFRALHARFARPWLRWDEPLRSRDARAIADARHEHADEIRLHQYVQWIAESQWRRAHRATGLALFGDLPFMVSGDSADVWSRQDEFDLDASVGVPSDAFSEDGQDWGLPPYRWDTVAATDYAWLRQRARRHAAIYDGYRVDHLVGFYRTFIRPPDEEPYFSPAEEPDQIALGERLLSIFAGEGARVIAEDLGTVPDFVRESLARLGVPGYKVLRWEREWKEPGQPFRDPAAYPPASVATTGTHDTETLAEWWEGADAEEREAVGRIPALARRGVDWGTAAFTPAVRDALLEVLLACGSDLVLLPVQDVFGWRDRINVPATIGDDNWTWRLPWLVDTLGDQPEAAERAHWLRGACLRHGRVVDGVPR